MTRRGGPFPYWYRGGGVWDGIRADRRPEPCTCYAESRDGIHWERPVLGTHETRGIRGFEPSRDNNIVIHGSTAKHVCVFKDGNPAAPDSERYKAIGLSSGFDPPGTLRGLVSPDGLHWKVLDKDPILTAPVGDHWPHFDSHNTALWDSNLGRYVAYMRGMDPRFGVFETYPPGIRSIRRSVSPDFRSWSKPQFIELLTRPLKFEGRELVLNYATSAAGSLRVEVQDTQGRPAKGHALSDCREIIGDEIERIVTWKSGSDLGSLSGKPVRLRFALKDADLYSIHFRT